MLANLHDVGPYHDFDLLAVSCNGRSEEGSKSLNVAGGILQQMRRPTNGYA